MESSSSVKNGFFDRKILGINFSDAFITGAVTIALPLLLVQRNIDVSTIGIVFSLLPIIFTITRVISASFADQIGFKKFFTLNGLANFLHIAIFWIANNPLLYAFGKIGEGWKNAFIWAVNRSSVITTSKHEHVYRGNSKINFARLLGLAAGSIAVGITIAKFSFGGVFAICLVFSIAIVLLSLLLKKDGSIKSFNFKATLKKLDLRNKSPLFKRTSIAMIFQTIATATLTGFALPIFLENKGLAFETIGLLFAGYYLINAAVIFIAIKMEFSAKKILNLQIAFFSIGAIGLIFAQNDLIFIPLLIMAAGDSLGGIIFEMIVANAAKGSKSVSVDVGWLHVPSHIGNSLGIFFGGFIIQFFGFSPLFIICAISFAIYTFLGKKIIQG